VVATVSIETERRGRAVLEIRRADDSKFHELIRLGGEIIASSQVEWFSGGGDAAVSAEWTPILSQDGKGDAYIFIGHIRKGVAVRAVYADGSKESVPLELPKDRVGGGIVGFFLYETTDARREKRLLRLEAVDEAGHVVGKTELPRGVG